MVPCCVLLRQSGEGFGPLPTASCGRGPALIEAWDNPGSSNDGCPPAAPGSGSSQDWEKGGRVRECTVPLTPQMDGHLLPKEIQCIEIMRAVLQTSQLPGGFQHFAQRSLTMIRTVDGPQTPRSDPWPCPPPLWRRWTCRQSLSPRKRKRMRLLETKARCVQSLVLALNWLSLGHPKTPPLHARAGFPMSEHQLLMIERLEDLVDYFLSAPASTVEDLGRAGEKLTKLGSVAFNLHSSSIHDFQFEDLHSFLTCIQGSFDSYSKRARSKQPDTSTPPPYEPERDAAEPLSPAVRVPTSSCTAMPVKADRIKWKLAPAFDPSPFLSDPVVKRAFRDPDFLRRPEDEWPRPPRAKVHADRGEVFRLAQKWDALRACSLVPCSQKRAIETVGLFAVPKDSEFDRLILNPTVVNSRCHPYSAFTKTIAPGYLMALIRLREQEDLLISSDDLCEFYYTFQVTPQRAKRNAIGVVFRGSEFQTFHCYDPSLHSTDVYVCLSTLAMGDALAVEIAQQSHVNVLRTLADCMRPEECLLYRQPVPRGPFYELLTIDDHIGLQKMPKGGSKNAAYNRDVTVFQAANRAYETVKLTAHPGKMRRRDTHATVLGAELDGSRGRCSAPRERIALLSYITCIVICKGLLTRQLLQGLLGCWTHVLLFRRPLFAILDKVYHEGESFPADLVFRMSSQCRHELLLLCLLAPCMQTDMRVEVAPNLYMLDASPFGGGLCQAAFSSTGAEELWRRTEQRGFYTCLQQGAGAALRELGLEHTELFGDTTHSEPPLEFTPNPLSGAQKLRDTTKVYDCIELFAGQGNWSAAHAAQNLVVHPGIEREATGRGYGDLSNDDTFHLLAKLAYQGCVKDWHAGPPCWSFGTLRRPRLRSKGEPAGFQLTDPITREQTLLAIRTAFLLTLACLSGAFISCEQPGSSVMFELQCFQRLLDRGCRITKFCFCSFGTAFMKPSKWLHNKPWYDSFAGQCSCKYKGHHFTIEGTFTRASAKLFDAMCVPDSRTVYGKYPTAGEAVSKFSASYPRSLCQEMAKGCKRALESGAGPAVKVHPQPAFVGDDDGRRLWYEDPLWVEDICESLSFRELFRFRFKKTGHINCLECRVYKTWLKHCCKTHPRSRIVSFLDSRVTMGAAAKGRSSSAALSRILRTSLGYILGGCLYPGALHCRSAWNRADGPSWDCPVPGPSRPMPMWLRELREGRTEGFDQMVEIARWSRPLGRWIRLLLMLAGDIERNPGPPRSAAKSSDYVPRGELNLLGGFATATSTRMQRCLEAFRAWCTAADLDFDIVCSSAENANMALKAYGLALFREGKPRYLLVYAITAVQQLFPEYRRSLAGAWQVDFKWQFEEPGQCRAVLSAPVLRAVLAVALLWGWYSFAGVVALGFGGMLHPSEFLALTRQDLVFPEDTLMQQKALYVFIRNPKTARFARRQHARIDDLSLVCLIRCIFGSLPLSSPSSKHPLQCSAGSGIVCLTGLEFRDVNLTEGPHQGCFVVVGQHTNIWRLQTSVRYNGRDVGHACVPSNIIYKK